MNTTLGLLGAVLAVFAMSAVVGGRINMVHVQNSTLAGGVAMGAACTLEMVRAADVIGACVQGRGKLTCLCISSMVATGQERLHAHLCGITGAGVLWDVGCAPVKAEYGRTVCRCTFWDPYGSIYKCGACTWPYLGSCVLSGTLACASDKLQQPRKQLTAALRCITVRWQTPGGAILVGFGAGCISTLGFQYLTPFLDRTIGLGDTCGE